MTFTDAVRSVFSRYAGFSGRARRSEYWYFYLFTVLVSIAASIADALLRPLVAGENGVVGALASLVLLLPGLAVTVRRLHDTGRRGWWVLLPLAPTLLVLVGVVWLVLGTVLGGGVGAALALVVIGCLLMLAATVTLLVFMCLDSDPGPNRYGPSPKEPPFPGDGWGYASTWTHPTGVDQYGDGPPR